jgi:hypothetical protein
MRSEPLTLREDARHAPIVRDNATSRCGFVYRFGKGLALALLVALVAVGCLPGPGQGIVDRIRAANSPMVKEVVLSPVNPWEGKDYEDIILYLVNDVTDEAAFDLWCTVIVPAGADRLGPKGEVRMYKGIVKWPGGGISGGIRVLKDAPTCGPGATYVPTPSPPIPPSPAPFVPTRCTTITSPAPSGAPVDCSIEKRAVREAVADVGFDVASVLIHPYGFPCGIPFPPRGADPTCPVALGSSTAYVTFVGTDKVAALTFASTPRGAVVAVIVAFEAPAGGSAPYTP